MTSYFSDSEGYLGLDTGLRAHLPTRIVPYAGIGSIAGVSRTVKSDIDGIDNDVDKIVDEPNESHSEIDRVLFAIYPELGVHTRLNAPWRISTYGRYMVASLGRHEDNWMLGGQLAFFPKRINK